MTVAGLVVPREAQQVEQTAPLPFSVREHVRRDDVRGHWDDGRSHLGESGQ
jgi:hypothetical protein